MRDSLTQLQRLRNPKIYSWQPKEPREIRVYFYSECWQVKSQERLMSERRNKRNGPVGKQAGRIPSNLWQGQPFVLLRPLD